MEGKAASTIEQGFDPAQIPEEAGDWGKGAVDEIRRLREEANQSEWAKDINPETGQKLAALVGDDDVANKAYIDYGLEEGWLEPQEEVPPADPGDSYTDPEAEVQPSVADPAATEAIDDLRESVEDVQEQVDADANRRDATEGFSEGLEKHGEIPDAMTDLLISRYSDNVENGKPAKQAAMSAYEDVHSAIKSLREGSADEDADLEGKTPAPSPGEGGAVVTTGEKPTIEQIVEKNLG